MIELIQDKVIVINGAAGGFGQLIAKRLSPTNKLVLLDINEAKLEAMRDELSNYEQHISYYKIDLYNESSIQSTVFQIQEEYKHIDLLINTAGYLKYMDLESVEIDIWDKVHQINLRSVLILTKGLLPMLKNSYKSKIINISSVAATNPLPGGGAYASSKAALNTLTKIMAKEYAKYKINVNSISPGPIEGEFLENNSTEESRKMRAENTLFKRLGTYEDLIGPILFLSSDLSDWITGQDLVVDGGFTV